MRPNYTTTSNRDLQGPTRVRVCAAHLASAGSEPTIADLATIDIIAQGEAATIDESSFRESISADTFLAEVNDADAFANVVAGALRLRFLASLPLLPWICLMKTATGLSAGGVPPTLAGLISEFGVEAELTNRVCQRVATGAVAEMWGAALVLAAIVRSGCPIRRALLMSQVITPPYLAIPGIDDDVAWRYLPDDLLAGLHKCPHDFPNIVVERAWREIGRRRATGHIPNLRAINWRLPGVVPYGVGETSDDY